MSTGERSRKTLALFSPANCYKAGAKIKTVRDVFKYPARSLGSFRAEFGRSWVLAYIKTWLLDLNDSVQANHKLNEVAMEFIAERIFETYPLKVTDLTLFFRNVKSGLYGQFYENLSPDKIMTWLAKYWDERCEAGAMEAQQSHDNFSMTKDPVHPEVAKKMFEGVGDANITPPEGKGFGSRERAKYDTPDDYTPPIQDRGVYLDLLKETAKTTETKYLLTSIETLREKGNEPDALAVLENELKKRK